jgi:hypothetical protein
MEKDWEKGDKKEPPERQRKGPKDSHFSLEEEMEPKSTIEREKPHKIIPEGEIPLHGFHITRIPTSGEDFHPSRYPYSLYLIEQR